MLQQQNSQVVMGMKYAYLFQLCLFVIPFYEQSAHGLANEWTRLTLTQKLRVALTPNFLSERESSKLDQHMTSELSSPCFSICITCVQRCACLSFSTSNCSTRRPNAVMSIAHNKNNNIKTITVMSHLGSRRLTTLIGMNRWQRHLSTIVSVLKCYCYCVLQAIHNNVCVIKVQ